MIDLLQPVRVKVPTNDGESWPAILIGRTYEEHTHFDVRLPDGAVLSGIPYGLVEVADVFGR